METELGGADCSEISGADLSGIIIVSERNCKFRSDWAEIGNLLRTETAISERVTNCEREQWATNMNY